MLGRCKICLIYVFTSHANETIIFHFSSAITSKENLICHAFKSTYLSKAVSLWISDISKVPNYIKYLGSDFTINFLLCQL